MGSARVLVHCNAGAEYGMGHLMRSLALAEEAREQGWDVMVGGDLSDLAQAHAARVLPGIAIEHREAPDTETWFADALVRFDPHVVHLDTYWDVPEWLMGGGALVSNMQDGPYGARRTQIAIDANLGAELWFARPELSDYRILGASAAVIRQQVRAQRGREPSRHDQRRVLVVLGGTDSERLTERVVRGLNSIGEPLELTIVVGADQQAAVVAAAAEGQHSAMVCTFLDDLPAVAREQDLVISAAGTSVWDFACMGVPMALICAVDNQRRGYRAIVEAGLAHPLGEPEHSDLASAVAGLAPLLSEIHDSGPERARLRAAIDGLGAWRIVSSWRQLVYSPPHPVNARRLVARSATMEDSRLLFDWRNDVSTRAYSRNGDELTWESHTAWFSRSLSDDDRRLLIIEADRTPVGTVRWDRRTSSDWEVSITVAPTHRGQGLAQPVLAAGERALRVRHPVRMLAAIHQDNESSRRLFACAGYLPHLPRDVEGFDWRAKWRFGTP